MRLNGTALLASVLLAGAAYGGPEGTLDPSFGGSGRVTTSTLGGFSEGNAIAAQPDGKLVVVGKIGTGNAANFGVFRYMPDGALDPTFGSEGRAVTDVSGGEDGAAAVALQPDGKIVVAGTGNHDFAVARYLADGTLDATFGMSGVVVTDVDSGDDGGWAVVLQPDGKIVVGGFADPDFALTLRQWALVRYLPDGTLDASFGVLGRVIELNGPFAFRTTVRALAVQSDGGIIATGIGDAYGTARFLTDGTLDVAFGHPGSGGHALLVEPDDSILSGTGTNGGAVFHMLADGSPGAPVGSIGLFDPVLGGGIVRQADGKLLVTAMVNQPPGLLGVMRDRNPSWVVGRLNPDRTLDTTFGAGGTAIVDGGLWGIGPQGLVSTPDGRVVVVGTFGFGSHFDLMGLFAGTCGNGTTEAGEECDDGNLTPGDGCDPACCLVDTDGDGACDVNDPCTGSVTATAKLTVTHFAGTDPPSNAGDETLSLSADAILPHPFVPALDPVVRGARLRLFGASGTLLDVAAGPGAYTQAARRGWKVNGTGTKWTFVDRSYNAVSGPPGSIVSLAIQDLSSRTPGRVKITAKGKKGFFETLGDESPLSFEVVIDAPTAETGQCVVGAFPGPPPAPTCTADPVRRKLLCK